MYHTLILCNIRILGKPWMSAIVIIIIIIIITGYNNRELNLRFRTKNHNGILWAQQVWLSWPCLPTGFAAKVWAYENTVPGAAERSYNASVPGKERWGLEVGYQRRECSESVRVPLQHLAAEDAFDGKGIMSVCKSSFQ